MGAFNIQNQVTKKTVIKSFIWTFLERSGVQGIQFIVSILLARMLLPEEYGTIALLTIFIQIANTFIQSGFGTALIQKKDTDNSDFSTLFFFSLSIAAICYAVLFLAAPLIAKFYGQEILSLVLRMLGLSCFSTSVNCIQYAYISKYMLFQKRFVSSTLATLVSGTAGIVCAVQGLGVWALVVQQLSYGYLVTVILWFTVKWRPDFYFSLGKLKRLLQYSLKLTAASLLDTVFGNVHGLVIGKYYNSTQLGIFDKGQNFPKFISNNLDTAISGVMFPTLSSYNDNPKKLRTVMNKAVKMSSYIITPCMFGLLAIGTPLIKVLLTDKWLDCVIFLRLACISYSFVPVNSINLQAINALGRSDIFLKLSIIKRLITIVCLILTLPFGLTAVAAGQVISCVSEFVIDIIAGGKLTGFGAASQLKTILPYYVISILMCAAIYPVSFFNTIPQPICLFLQILSGILFYAVISAVLKIDCFYELLHAIYNRFPQKLKKQNKESTQKL